MATYRNSVSGAERISGTPMGYPWIEVDTDTLDVQGQAVPAGEQTELAAMTADAILLEVGNDPDLAQIALDEEEARETPRVVLSAKLQRIIDNAAS